MEKAIPADREPLTLARCLEAAGKFAEAEAAFRRLLDEAPGDFVAVRQVAEFYLRGDQPAKAEPVLRHLLAPSTMAPADVALWARRQLAVVLAMGNAPGSQEEALNLLAKNSVPYGQLTEDERFRAFVLSCNPPSREDAVRLFEQTLSRAPLTADQRLLLIQIYQAQGDEAKASSQMHALLTLHRDNPRYLTYNIRSLLRRGAVDAAQPLLNSLELMEPDNPRTNDLRSAFAEARRKEE